MEVTMTFTFDELAEIESALSQAHDRYIDLAEKVVLGEAKVHLDGWRLMDRAAETRAVLDRVSKVLGELDPSSLGPED